MYSVITLFFKQILQMCILSADLWSESEAELADVFDSKYLDRKLSNS